MMLCLDVGNSRAKAGLLKAGRLLARFERETGRLGTRADWVEWLRSGLDQRQLPPQRIDGIRSCNVVPDLQPVLEAACLELFGQVPFVLEAGTQSTLTLDYREPNELGSDRIAAAIGACQRWPGEHLIVVGCGTALTFCCIDASRRHLGGAITAGPRLIAQALHAGTGRLPQVEFEVSPLLLGQCTQSSIQSGLFYGLLGQVRELSSRLRTQCFAGQNTRLVGTGGHAAALQAMDLFDCIEPDLVLLGLSAAQP